MATEVVIVKLSDIRPYPDNVKIHNRQNVMEIAKSIKSFGYLEYGVIDENNELLAGHGRYLALMDLNFIEAEFIKVDHLTNEEKRLYRIADNVLTEKSKYNYENLKREVLALKNLGGDISLTFLKDSELKKIGIDVDLTRLPEETSSAGEYDPIPIKQGDIIELGKHKLICGDSSDEKTVKLLFSGKKAQIVVTSPPYYNQREYSQFSNYLEYNGIMSQIIRNFEFISDEIFIIFWNVGSDVVNHKFIPADHYAIIKSLGYEWDEWITWKKPAPTYMSNPRHGHIIKSNIYTPVSQQEAILVFSKGKLPKFDKSDDREVYQWVSDVWEFSQNSGSQMSIVNHSALFPLELPYRALKCYSKTGDIVFEPFLGGGTTLIAAEKTGRICYGVERDPISCNSIINRYVNYSGNNIIKLNGEEVDYSKYLIKHEVDKNQVMKIEVKKIVSEALSPVSNFEPEVVGVLSNMPSPTAHVEKEPERKCFSCEEFDKDIKGRRRCDIAGKFVGKDSEICEDFMGV